MGVGRVRLTPPKLDASNKCEGIYESILHYECFFTVQMFYNNVKCLAVM